MIIYRWALRMGEFVEAKLLKRSSLIVLSIFFATNKRPNRFLHLRYNLGSGEVNIQYNTTRVSDGLWHRIRAFR